MAPLIVKSSDTMETANIYFSITHWAFILLRQTDTGTPWELALSCRQIKNDYV